MAESIAKRLEQIDDLPTIPQTLQRVLEGLERASTTAKHLDAIIREDPVLTAKILKVANSPYYGLKGEVSSIAHAVVILGFEEVKNMVIGLSLTGTFSGDLGFEEFKAPNLWLHSIGVASAAKLVAERVPGLDPDELFTGGMLHDLGRFLMCLYFKPELKEILALQRKNGTPLWKVEQEYGLSHGEVGAYLTTRWGLSDLLVSVVRYHHRPQGAGPFAKAAAAVFLADSLCHKLELGWGEPAGVPDKLLIPRALGLDVKSVKGIAGKLKALRDGIRHSWNTVIG